MKKNYLLGIGLLLAGSSFAQTGQLNKVINGLNPTSTKAYPSIANAKNPGDSIWGSNFSNVADWTIDNNGQTGPTFGWNINATSESWAGQMGVINSVSHGNYAELSNGNPTLTPGTQALNVVYKLTTTNAITIPNSSISLQFLQHGANFYDAQEIVISVDGGTNWIKVGDNSNIPPLTDAGGAWYANPTKKVVNLASYIPAGTTSIKIGFRWTTAVPAQATNPNVWTAYGWGIDDVKLFENLQYDLTLDDVVWGVGADLFPYYKTPVTQIQGIKIGGVVTNNGSLASTDAKFSAAVASASFTGSSAPSALTSGESDTLFLTTDFTPAATVGSYTINGFNVNSVLHPETDANNSLAKNVTLEVTNNIYARDNGVKDGTFRDANKAAYEIGNWFQIWEPITTMALDVFIENTTSTGTAVFVTIRDADRVLVAQSQEYIIKATDKNKFITIKFDEFIDLDGESFYFAGVATQGGVGTRDLVVGTGGYSPDQSSVLYRPAEDTWYFTNNTPMVRFNFDQTLGVNQIENSVVEFGKLYPNPTSAGATLSYNLKNNADVTVKVVDVTGKTVFAADQGSQTSGSHELTINADAFSAGVYHVTIVANDMKVTQMLVKK